MTGLLNDKMSYGKIIIIVAVTFAIFGCTTEKTSKTEPKYGHWIYRGSFGFSASNSMSPSSCLWLYGRHFATLKNGTPNFSNMFLSLRTLHRSFTFACPNSVIVFALFIYAENTCSGCCA